VPLGSGIAGGGCNALAQSFDQWVAEFAFFIEWSQLDDAEDANARLLKLYCKMNKGACGTGLEALLSAHKTAPLAVPEAGPGGVLGGPGRILGGAGKVSRLTEYAQKVAKGWLPEQVFGKIPQGWAAGIPTKKATETAKQGVRWFGPNKNAQGVRIDKGDPASNWPYQRVDHVVVRDGGRILGRDGKPIGGTGKLEDIPEAHIPLTEWLKWRQWNQP
jgi:hypothetical protein